MKKILIGIQVPSKSRPEVKSDQLRKISNTIFTVNVKLETRTFTFQNDYFSHSLRPTLLIPEKLISKNFLEIHKNDATLILTVITILFRIDSWLLMWTAALSQIFLRSLINKGLQDTYLSPEIYFYIEFCVWYISRTVPCIVSFQLLRANI